MSQGGVITIPTAAQNLSFVTNAGTATSSMGIINVVGAGGATTSGAGNTVTINLTASSFTWNVVTSANNTVNVATQNAYIAKGASQVIFKLPAAAAVGDTFYIVGYGNLWTLNQNAGQQIFFGVQQTTVGVGGSITATMIKDRIEVVCVTANTEFEVITSIGNLSIV